MRRGNFAALNCWTLGCTVILMLGLLAGGCEDNINKNLSGDRAPTPTPPKLAKVKQIEPSLYTLTFICGSGEILWRGPTSTVTAKFSGTKDCPAHLWLRDKRTGEDVEFDPKLVTTSEDVARVKVDAKYFLYFTCYGPGKSDCSAQVLGVEPEGIPLAPPTAIPGDDTETNPTKPPPAGTKVKLDCGEEVVLWSGNMSYLTVVARGTKDCYAKVKGKLSGQPDQEVQTGKQAHCYTLGPATEIAVSCDKSSAGKEGTCEFQITGVIELPN